MIVRRDGLKPIQPYFVLDTDHFRQEIYLKQGISHFYSFYCKEIQKLRIVPDGCTDLFFAYAKQRMTGFVYGTVTEFQTQQLEGVEQVFGVRFLPGIQPALISVQMKELLNCHVELEKVLIGDGAWLLEMASEQDFYQRIRIFLQAYSKAEKLVQEPFGKRAIAMTVKRLIYASDGKIKVGEIAEQTGYSERYVHKVFREEMGFSPKVFCKIIQFQRMLDRLNAGVPDNIAEIAVEFGYYDQPQFIRDFKKYAGATPKAYVSTIIESGYVRRIQTNKVPNEE